MKSFLKKFIKPKRIIILGSNGFVASAVKKKLIDSNIKFLALSRQKLDLTKKKSYLQLSKFIKPSDYIFFTSAKAPVKNITMLLENLLMVESLVKACTLSKPKHIFYLSSDAVYADSKKKLTEKSDAIPGSLHGLMHYSREIIIKSSLKIPICFIRPTLIFGSTDPHNGYGPNSFKRLVLKKKDIQLFGKGEELRDHIFIDDVAKLIVNVFLCRYEGSLNIATGKVISFHEIAKIIKNKYQSKIKIKFSKRKGPMPHNGYRPFNVGTIYKLFPDFKFTNFEKAILK